MITNPGSKTRVDEVADSLVVDEEPLLFHTGPRRMFPLVREAVAVVLPAKRVTTFLPRKVPGWASGALQG